MHDTTRPDSAAGSTPRTDPTLSLILGALVAYAVAAAFGWPQHGRNLLVGAQAAQDTVDHAAERLTAN